MMQAFLDNARVQVSDDGLYFYETDIIMSKYQFHNDLQIELNLDYQRSGFGIVLCEDEEEGPMESKHKYLFHCGTNTYEVLEKHLLQQTKMNVRSNTLRPGLGTVHLQFNYTRASNRIKLYMLINDDGTDRLMEIGSHVLKRKFDTYYIGFYSVAGNTIHDVTFLQGIPNHWSVSIANVHGGRISFWDDGFKFEDCIHDAELEQRAVTLPPGKYYFAYDTAPVNGKFDIEGFIYDADTLIPKGEVYIDKKASDALPNLTDTESKYYRKRGRLDERYLEDEGKNLLKEDGSFELSHDTNIVVSFKGMNGFVDHVCVKDDAISEFIATGDTMKRTDGSWIEVDLTNVVNVRWEGIIYKVPPYIDLTKKCPYGIMATTTDRIMLDALAIQLEEKYSYSYDVATSVLSSHVFDSEAYSADRKLNLTSADHNIVKLFMNMKATMDNLILTMSDGTEININVQKAFKALVPGYIKGPIIVTDENNASFELSANYREVVRDDAYAIDYFYKHAIEMKLSHHTTNISYVPEVYGIVKGATITPTEQNDIAKFATSYTKINSNYVSIKDDILKLPASVRDDYEYIAIKYQRADLYNYRFVVYGREVFEGTEDRLQLEGVLNDSGQGTTVYGITEEGNYQEEYLLRIPNADMEESIDLCVKDYDMISPTLYTLDIQNSTIKLDKSLKGKYEYYIVEYLQKNAYAINWNEEYKQYEVDISSDESKIRVHYEFDATTKASDDRIRTEILSNENKFIILRRQKGAFLDED